MFTAGVWLPVPVMPGLLGGIVALTPLGAGALALSEAASGGWPDLKDLAVIVGWTAVLGSAAHGSFAGSSCPRGSRARHLAGASRLVPGSRSAGRARSSVSIVAVRQMRKWPGRSKAVPRKHVDASREPGDVDRGRPVAGVPGRGEYSKVKAPEKREASTTRSP